jgi:hypothetical protein
MQRVSSISTLTSLRVEFLCTKLNRQPFLSLFFFAFSYKVSNLIVPQYITYQILECQFEIIEGIADSYDDVMKHYILNNIHVRYARYSFSLLVDELVRIIVFVCKPQVPRTLLTRYTSA